MDMHTERQTETYTLTEAAIQRATYRTGQGRAGQGL